MDFIQIVLFVVCTCSSQTDSNTRLICFPKKNSSSIVQRNRITPKKIYCFFQLSVFFSFTKTSPNSINSFVCRRRRRQMNVFLFFQTMVLFFFVKKIEFETCVRWSPIKQRDRQQERQRERENGPSCFVCLFRAYSFKCFFIEKKLLLYTTIKKYAFD